MEREVGKVSDITRCVENRRTFSTEMREHRVGVATVEEDLYAMFCRVRRELVKEGIYSGGPFTKYCSRILNDTIRTQDL